MFWSYYCRILREVLTAYSGNHMVEFLLVVSLQLFRIHTEDDFRCLFGSVLNRYHLQDLEGKIVQEQKGVIRTNCIDCLDRTNVTQVCPCSPYLTLRM